MAARSGHPSLAKRGKNARIDHERRFLPAESDGSQADFRLLKSYRERSVTERGSGLS